MDLMQALSYDLTRHTGPPLSPGAGIGDFGFPDETARKCNGDFEFLRSFTAMRPRD
jgi:hypothetical protein